MLQIDTRGEVRSLPPRHIAAPYLRERFHHHPAQVKAFFQRCRQDNGFVQALRDEAQRCLAWQPSSLHYPEAMIAAAMDAIAKGLIGVASLLPDDISVRFDPLRPKEWTPFRTVVFADQAMATQFVTAMLETPQVVAAFEAALADPDGRRHGAGFPAQPAAASDGRPPPGTASAGHARCA